MEQLDQLLSARKSLSASLAAFEAQARELPHAAPALLPVITALRAQKAEVQAQIQHATTTQSEFEVTRRLQAVPGIGPVSAATLASRLASRTFPSSDAFVAFCGLDVGVRQSGTKSGSSGLTKQGDAELRRLLYLAAQANLRCKDSPFKAHYERERHKGLSSTAALCAVARKLARLCWALHKQGTCYDSQRVYHINNPDTLFPFL